MMKLAYSYTQDFSPFCTEVKLYMEFNWKVNPYVWEATEDTTYCMLKYMLEITSSNSMICCTTCKQITKHCLKFLSMSCRYCGPDGTATAWHTHTHTHNISPLPLPGLWSRYMKPPTQTPQFLNLRLRLLHKSSICVNNGKPTTMANGIIRQLIATIWIIRLLFPLITYT
jgi:hypothetical protein